ncbi:MAG: hypothetical protein JSV58_03505 [Candidatus Bathyarchaeota archaeon]|nr:MAG: hypothetical protein JSV58_03505 [Candidatus Bathyarchaeota archaeon]
MEVQNQMRVMQKDLMEAEDIDFTDEKEYWNTYKLKDGTTLKIKLVLRGVKRLKKWSPDGLPVYVINSRNIVRVVDVPKNLKAEPKPSAFKPV